MIVQLSSHFTLDEMTQSDYALRHGIDNTPSQDEVNALGALCRITLEPIRTRVDAPVIITSGYRSPEVNKGIGGATTSQHMKGEAADFHVLGMSNLVTLKLIVHSPNPIPFDQAIYEFGEDGWVHVSHSFAGQQRREVLRAYRGPDGKTVYEPFTV